MTRAEIIDEILEMYFVGVPLKKAMEDFKDEIRKLGREKKDGVCKVSDTSNEDKR